MANEFKQTDATTREFTLEFLEQITDNFSEEKIIGRGGYGVVYKVSVSMNHLLFQNAMLCYYHNYNDIYNLLTGSSRKWGRDCTQKASSHAGTR
jgi:hypothetical protein